MVYEIDNTMFKCLNGIIPKAFKQYLIQLKSFMPLYYYVINFKNQIIFKKNSVCGLNMLKGLSLYITSVIFRRT